MSRANYSPQQFRALWAEFAAPSWRPWATVEDCITGKSPTDPALARQVTGRKVLPAAQVSEAVIIAGRGAGKSRFTARLAVYFAAGREYQRVPGERIYVGVFAPDRKQAGVTFRYVVGLLRAVPSLERMVVRERREAVELSNGVTIEVITASKAAPRGRSYALAIVEEAAFLPQADTAEPDVELLRALRPALARVPGSLLLVVSSPYARRGVLWDMRRRYHGRDNSDAVLVVEADTLTLNPSFNVREVERAFEEDPVAAAAEYGRDGEISFRTDVETFIGTDVVDAVVVPGVRELPPRRGQQYVAFLDFAGGSGQDSAAVAIAHREDNGDAAVRVLDAVREVRPRFSPEQVCKEFAELLQRYGVTRAKADRYAADWPLERMAKHGVTVEPADRTKSDYYRELLPLLNSAEVQLLDGPRLRAQLLGLERRVARGGRDSIDHAPGGHDDVANAAAGALVEAGARRTVFFCGNIDAHGRILQ